MSSDEFFAKILKNFYYCENNSNLGKDSYFFKILRAFAPVLQIFLRKLSGKRNIFSQNFQNITSSKYYVKMVPVLMLLINIAFCNKLKVKINICYFLRRFLWKLYVFFRKSFHENPKTKISLHPYSGDKPLQREPSPRGCSSWTDVAT